MDYSFIEKCKKILQSSSQKELENKAYTSIIDNLFRRNIYGREKATGIDEYDSESLFSNTQIYPGMIYAFIYEAKNPTKYSDGKIQFEYYDKLPIVLVTHVQNNLIRGINLNLCPPTVRAYIINSLRNLDLEFFDRTAHIMTNNGQAPISMSITKTFLSEAKEVEFYQHIKNLCKLKCTDFLFRHYSLSNIKTLRLIENWQHTDLVFLRYTGEMKQNILNKIYELSGLNATLTL